MSTKNLADYKKILDKKPPQLCLFISKTVNVNDEMHKFLHDRLKKDLPELESIRLNGLEVDAATFHAELSTIPMFQTGRLTPATFVWLAHPRSDANDLNRLETRHHWGCFCEGPSIVEAYLGSTCSLDACLSSQ